ncbi:NAD(P)-dependent oxidoreductase [Desulfovibrio aminophilus]|uniref:precorrin-2 dehydrogenase/sirohydrochlorin ferrochelatase family protein n=1 Tax=Desulfovibrio aminophilus TaxID=81425 RepID=UPI0033933FF3
MRYYPMFVNLENKSCLVVGSGEVGTRKIATLLSCGARSILVLDTREPDEGLNALLEQPGVGFERREFRDADLDGRFLVIASTSNEALNWRISDLCRERNLLCNIVDQPEKCSFIVPALVTQGDLTLAISTGGQSPALAKHLRKHLQESFGAEYGAFLVVMGRLRPMLLELDRPTGENTAVFRAVVGSRLMETLAAKDFIQAAAVLDEHLPEPLRPRIPELLHGLV